MEMKLAFNSKQAYAACNPYAAFLVVAAFTRAFRRLL